MNIEEAQRSLGTGITDAWQRLGLGELADAAGVGQNTIRNMAAGKLPHTSTLIRVADAAGITPCNLLGNNDHGIEGLLPGWAQLSGHQQRLIRQMVAEMADTAPTDLAAPPRAAEEAGDYRTTSAEARD